MPHSDTTLDHMAARRVAQVLLDIRAIHIRPAEPFTFTSGLLSPVYVDCRRVIAFPAARTEIMKLMHERALRELGAANIDAVAGGETAGIPYAAWLADRLDKPMLYVRKKPKGFGRNAQIEGTFEDGARVLLVEDLATDGGSKVLFVEALRTAGAVVTDSMVVFLYSNIPGGLPALNAIDIRLHALATWSEVLEVASEDPAYQDHDLDEVRAFLKDRNAWSLAHGGPAV